VIFSKNQNAQHAEKRCREKDKVVNNMLTPDEILS
jgi:hypothetical protein